MNNNEIKKLFFKNGKYNNSRLNESNVRIRQPEIWQLVTNFYTIDCSWMEKVYRFVNDITETPKCKCGCGKETKFCNVTPKRYLVYYSDNCKYKSYVGKGNPFADKQHSKKTKDLIGNQNRGRKYSDEVNAKKSLPKEKNGMFGKRNYDVWLEKYGKEVADQKEKETNAKKSNPGKKNGMFGKPSPPGSGNGWSGWFKEYYFRSLLELSFLIYLVKNNIPFESGELKKHRITYEVNNQSKNYFCDFYLPETDEYIEIKPKNLCNIVSNSGKFTAAKLKHKNFKVLTDNDIVKISFTEICNLVDQGLVILLDRYKVKFDERRKIYASDSDGGYK